MSATLLTLPQQDWAPGTYGPFVTAAVPSGASGYTVNYATSGANFPTTGGDVLTYQVERSDDGGGTWRFDASVTLGKGPWLASDRKTVLTSGSIPVSLGLPGGPNTLLRGTLIVIQPCNIGGTLESTP